jgi:hypothetical protein
LIKQLVDQKIILLKALDAYDARSRSDPVIPGMENLKKACTKRKFAALDTIVQLLAPICSMIDHLEGDSYPTLSLVQCLSVALRNSADKFLLAEEQKHTHSDTVLAVCKLVRDGVQSRFLYSPLEGLLDEYMPIDYIAAVFDPHTKHLSFLRSDAEKQFVYLAVDKLCRDLIVPKVATQNVDKLPDALKLLSTLDSPEKTPQSRSGAIRGNQRSQLYCAELASYLAEDRASFAEATLTWWMSKQYRFPTLSILAKIYLAIPASSATVERLFSRASIVRFFPLIFASNFTPFFVFRFFEWYVFPSRFPFALLFIEVIGYVSQKSEVDGRSSRSADAVQGK